jgi:Zn-dependent protease
MFGRSIKLGRLAGFDIELNITFLILLGLVVIFQGFAAGFALAVLVFGSVLLHELGHAVTARRLGVTISGIELHFFGGVAKMMGSPRSAKDEIKIAAAGPGVSFVLGGTALLLALFVPSRWVVTLAYVNLILGAFNLIPALPMDGGRIFRAALSNRLGRLKATEYAVKITHTVAVGIGALAAFTGMWHLVAIAVVLWVMGSHERRMARYWTYENEAPAVEVLGRDGESAGWFTEDGEPADEPAPGYRPRRSGQLTDMGAFESGIPKAPSGGGGSPHREVHRLPNGGWIVVERHRH